MAAAPDSPNPASAGTIPGMARRRDGLLAQIEADLLDDRVPLSSQLQRCLVLGGQAGEQELDPSRSVGAGF